MDQFINIFFFVFHSCLIAFILFGWIWRPTRRANLVVILLTFFSWTFLGIWFGYGYCPSTDWHWQVRARLGYLDNPDSYTKFLFDSLTGGDISQSLVDVGTALLLAAALAGSVFFNRRDFRKKRTKISD
jgi:hypothetical protein